ncbi:MAG: hypothetical protein QOI21_1791 [Actinomycetota bacterium]|jgi:hypothetical protein|nr:hypothetical protein [Actinomycetota bacterium]
MSAESTTEIAVRRSVTVPLDPERTFDPFTARMTDFWPPEHSIGTAKIAEVVVEPHAGGAGVAPTGRPGPSRTRFRRHPVRTTGTMYLSHRHLERYGEKAEAMRVLFESPGAWDGILTRFADFAS